MRTAPLLVLLILIGPGLFGQTIRKDSADRELKYYWDRMQSTWKLEEQWDFEFDSSNNLLSSTYIWFDTEGSGWKPWSREIIHYDSIDRISMYERHNWLPEESIWLPYLFDERYVSSLYITPAKTEYFYDRDGYTKEEIMYGWDRPDSVYFKSARRTVKTDLFGNETEVAEYSWDTSLGDWDMETMISQDRDSMGRVLEKIEYGKDDWWSEDGGPIGPVSRLVYELDSVGNQLSRKYYEYNEDIADWQITVVDECSFDVYGNIVERRDYYWMDEISDLILTRRSIHIFDSRGNMQYEKTFFLSDQAGQLVMADSSAYEYDPDGQMLVNSTFMFDFSKPGEAIPLQRTAFQYDSSGNRTEELYFDGETGKWIPAYKTNWHFDLQGAETSRYSYFWEIQDQEWLLQNGDSLWLSRDDSGRVLEEITYDYFGEDGWVPWYWRVKFWPDDLIQDQDIFVEENNQVGDVAGSILLGSGFDPSMVELEMASADPEGLLYLDTAYGEFRILTMDSFDYENLQVIELVINARDLSVESADSAQISIRIVNMNDNAPQLWDTVFTVAEDVGSPVELGTIRVEDADGDLNWNSLFLFSGNEEEIFFLDSYENVLHLLRPELLDYETRSTYELTVVASDGTFTTEGTVTVQVLDVEEITGLADLPPEVRRIYPNPAGEALYLELDPEAYQVRIHNLSGKMVYNGEVRGPLDMIDLSSLERGIYFITLYRDDFAWTGRVARQ